MSPVSEINILIIMKLNLPRTTESHGCKSHSSVLTRDFLSQKKVKELLSSAAAPFVFLESAVCDSENNNSFFFCDFTDIITFNYQDDPDTFFRKIEGYLKKGYWISGYFSYEFAYSLDPALKKLISPTGGPLAWLGVSLHPVVIQNQGYETENSKKKAYKVTNITSNLSADEYVAYIKKIKNFLEQGLTYQVNFTFKIRFDFAGSISDFYFNLRRAQPTPYTAFINTGENSILSFSPELFFRMKNGKVLSRPMKGTICRGLTMAQENKNKTWLRTNKKIKAENVMIVDLLRNDLGRVSERVWVTKLFNVEKYRTVYQLTSTIESKLKKNIKLKEIFSALFPCGSVTGAPKIKTMEIINSLEKEPRGIYTGAIGYISPRRKACFNVAIRTIVLSKGRGEMGVGGGIVYDSSAKKEYQEALLKAKFFKEKFPRFSLIESILWEKNKGYFLLGGHLKRLNNSCGYFLIPLDFKELKSRLRQLERSLRPINQSRIKVKILVSTEGKIRIQQDNLPEINAPVKVKLNSRKINPRNIFIYHKTTHRSIYDRERQKILEQGFFETVFTNNRGELTEGTITNIFLLKKGILHTPALESGVLPGVLRENLLNEGRAKETVLFPEDIKKADKIYIGNSVRGLLEARIESG